jgi:outer membrane protein
MRKLFFALVVAISAVAGAQAQSKIAHMSAQKVLDTMPSRRAAISDIKMVEAMGMKELRDLDSAIQVEVANYQANATKWSPVVLRATEQKIQGMQQRLEEREQQINQQLQQMSADMNDKILDKVKKAVDIVAKKKGLNYVIDESATLFSSGTDITNEVITEVLKLEKQ